MVFAVFQHDVTKPEKCCNALQVVTSCYELTLLCVLHVQVTTALWKLCKTCPSLIMCSLFSHVPFLLDQSVSIPHLLRHTAIWVCIMDQIICYTQIFHCLGICHCFVYI